MVASLTLTKGLRKQTDGLLGHNGSRRSIFSSVP
ncbi:MAG: hypothetical protein JWO31_1730 [Phycisphaerales bacterium]|nr:hypothetical protein [Phycisphaerales bacterium]